MTRTTLPAAAGSNGSGGVPPLVANQATGRLPRQPRQRRPVMAALGVLVLAGGAVAGYFGMVEVSQRHPMLVAARDIPVGKQITAEDLTSAPAGVDGAIAALPASRATSVVGRYAVVEVKAGTLLPGTAVGDARRPGPGEALVPVALKPGQVPARGLRAGDLVEVMPTATDQPLTSADAKKQSSSADGAVGIPALVDQAAAAVNSDGDLVVDLLVAEEYKNALGRYIASSSFVVALTARRP